LAAEKGHIEAQYNLALVYADPSNPSQDYLQAFYWHLQAAHQGHMRACYNVGMCFHKGLGFPKDQTAALYWYTLAAERGYSRAQCNLALIYLDGGIKYLNYDQGIRWLLIAAKNGYAPAQEKLKNLLHLKEKVQAVQQEEEDLLPSNANFEDFNKTCEILKQTVENLYLKYKEEVETNELKEPFSIPFLYYHSRNLTNLAERALSIINLLATKAYFIDSVDLADCFYSMHSQRKEHYYESYSFQNNTYLCLGKEAVKEGEQLIPFLKGQDKVYEAALISINILEEIYKNKDKTLIGKAINLRHLASQGIAIDQTEFTKVLESVQKTGLILSHPEGESIFFQSIEDKEQYLTELEELKNLPKRVTQLFIKGTQHRNALFKEEYLFLF